jgi:Flp pilus assembly protein CpaB
MRASTLFGLTIAALLGLGVVVGAKYMGYFDTGAPAEAKKKESGYQMLIAAKNLFKGTAPGLTDVKAVPVTDAELDFYQKNKDKLLAPLPGAVAGRVLARNVAAGQPLVEDFFEPQAFPEAVSERLDPGMRSVSLVLPRERAAGGLIRTGERVDVLLTSMVQGGGPADCPTCAAPIAFSASAAIARNLKVVVKRDNLWTVMQPVPQDKPVSFILQANPYRAALIEYAKSKGLVTLVPAALPAMGKDKEPPLNDPDSREYRDEDKRVAEFVNNEHIISDNDLERIFNLKLLPAPTPPVRVEMLSGAKFRDTATFQGEFHQTEAPGLRRTKLMPVSVGPDSLGYRFSMPDSKILQAAQAGKDCPTCGKKAQ